MGILDNFAERVAKQIVKASPIATPISNAQIQQALGVNAQGYGNSVGLPRDPNMANVPFTPGVPIVPGAINPVRPDGRPDPRRYEYQVAQNINITETRLVPFKTLRSAADQIDILRRCIEVLKQKMVALDWDIVLGEDAVEKVMAETGEKSNIKAMAIAKEKYTAEINRMRQFWEQPDVANGLLFADWLNMALEEILVIDAWAVWPQKTVGGDLLGLQILDGTTIKPLIDDRGMRPAPPNPAFQQILYGFPRSEFSAPVEGEDADGEFLADELAYMVKNRRTNTVYGFSPTERALTLADIYLRRQQWLRAEYTDGVLPELMFETDANFGNNPDLLRAYENVLNDDLAGQTEQRKRARILPAGIKPVQFDGYGEKFKDVLDEYLVNSICGHFGVLPTEIGFAPKGGLGGSGFQDGQAESSEVIGVLPLANWVGRMISNLSYVFAGMPRELEFKFQPSKRNEGVGLAQEQDIKRKNGGLTLNEQRSRDGLPLIDAPEADQPMIVTSAGAFFLTDEGLKPVGGEEASAPEQEPTEGDNAEGEPKPEPTVEEIREGEDDFEKGVTADLEKYDPEQARDSKTGRWSYGGLVGSLAVDARAKAIAAEPSITEAMKGVAAKHGGELTGLEYRIKSENSIARKIGSDAKNDYGVTQKSDQAEWEAAARASAAKMSDTVRYTMLASEKNYATMAKNVVADLESQGYQAKVKNYWQEGSNYKGINVALVDPQGMRVELQFHTASSFKMKETVNHPIYERYRKLAPGQKSKVARELNAQMVKNWEGVRTPPYIKTFGEPKIGKMIDLEVEEGNYE
jgi:hypothetical protein